MEVRQIGLTGAVTFGLLSATVAWGAPVQRIDSGMSGLPAHARAFVAEDTMSTTAAKKPNHHPAVVIHRHHHPHPMAKRKPASTTGEKPPLK